MSELKSAPKPVSIKLDADLKARLDAIAVSEDRTPHWLMQNAIATFVDKKERQAALQAEAVAAYEDYELTGLHVSGESANAWLKQLAAGINTPRPKWQS